MTHENKVFWYVAPTYRQAKEIVWKDPDMLNKYLPLEIVEKKNDSELTIYFKKTHSVLAVKGADDPDSLRGPNPYGTVLDEFEMMSPAVWEEIISPIATANPDAFVWFIGTPKPSGGHFKRLHEQAQTKDGWFALSMGINETGIIPPEQIESARATMTESAFEQEFLCKWHEEGGVVFRNVDRCVQGQYRENYDTRHKYQFGVDLAQHEDWTVLIALNKNTRTVEYFDRFNQIDFTIQKPRIEAALRRFGNPTCNMDATGGYETVVQDLNLRGLRINGLKFTKELKHQLVTNLMLLIEQGQIKFPNIPELVQELKDYGYEITLHGNIRYGAPEGMHDDCVMALALACWDLPARVPLVKMDMERRRTKNRSYQFY